MALVLAPQENHPIVGVRWQPPASSAAHWTTPRAVERAVSASPCVRPEPANIACKASPKAHLFPPSTRLQADPSLIAQATQLLDDGEDAVRDLARRSTGFMEALRRNGLQPADFREPSGLSLHRRALLLAMVLEHSETPQDCSLSRGSCELQRQLRQQQRILLQRQHVHAQRRLGTRYQNGELAKARRASQREQASIEDERVQRIQAQQRAAQASHQRRAQSAQTRWSSTLERGMEIAEEHKADLQGLHSAQDERSERSLDRRDVARERRMRRHAQQARAREHEVDRVRHIQEHERDRRAAEIQEESVVFSECGRLRQETARRLAWQAGVEVDEHRAVGSMLDF